MRRKRHFALIADILTTMRFLLAFVVIFMGWKYGAHALTETVAIVVLGWFTDALDGPFARGAAPIKTKLNRYDFIVDITFNWSILIYITMSGFLPLRLSLIYTIVVVLIVAATQRKAIAVIFMRPIDLAGVAFLLYNAPIVAGFVTLYVVGLVIVRWRRIKSRTKAWLHDMKGILSGKIKK